MTVCGYCHCKQSKAIHKQQKINTKTKKKKEFTIIYQVKELIFNFQFSISYVLIFNFQFSISYVLIFNFQFSISLSTPLLLRNLPPYKGRQALTNHYSLPFVIARSETTKQSTTTNNKHKNIKEKEFTIIYQVKELIFHF